MKHRYSLPAYLLIAIVLVCCQGGKESLTTRKLLEPVAPLYDSTLRPFYHGVASGDPLNDRVIIWTRITPEDSLASIAVGWEISETADFSTVVKKDGIITSPEKDYTVKVDVTGLKAGTTYY